MVKRYDDRVNGINGRWVDFTDYSALEAEVAGLRAALAEIAKGEGAFNRDPLNHAKNVIENMMTLAAAALAQAPAPDGRKE